ncbi:p-hydroxybenzoic acid efflux subunit AaeB [Salmonella enterica subsp. enterica serovar Typhi]|nr:p-hydroxybenzoic acid efflux subunit AaeB [Salmonella enterica subsp. enterica serovar Typhi]
MGIFSIANQHIRFAVKLACAIVLALFIGFHFQLETPRWAVLTAAIVAAGPAFAAGGEPYSGAIRYRGMLRMFVSAAVSAMTTNVVRRKENRLPALYQQLFLLMNKFPGDLPKFRLALTMIIAHQRLRDAPIPVNEDLSVFHRQLRRTADHVISAGSDDKRRRYFGQLLDELDIYQEKLRIWEAPPQVTEPVKRLTGMLHKYQNALTDS